MTVIDGPSYDDLDHEFTDEPEPVLDLDEPDWSIATRLEAEADEKRRSNGTSTTGTGPGATRVEQDEDDGTVDAGSPRHAAKIENQAYLTGTGPEPTLPRLTVEEQAWELEPRIWQHGDNATPAPVAEPGMFHGPAGRFALDAAEHTEACAEAIFAHALALLGALIGRGPHVMAGTARHAAALFMLIVGATGKARKGTSAAPVLELVRVLDETFANRCVMSGFGSGEALVEALDPRDPRDRSKRRPNHDHRAVVLEAEFAAVLARARREGATTSAYLRAGWDGVPLERRISGSVTKVKDYHLAVIGHITAEELTAKLTDSDLFNGFANRFLFTHARRHQLLPDGGNVPTGLIVSAARTLRPALDTARQAGEMARTPEADVEWRRIYAELAADDPPGMLGKACDRGDAQSLRVALVLALLDRSPVIDAEHVLAAEALWRYTRASAAHIFGERASHPRTQRVLELLRGRTTKGATLAEITRLAFSGHGNRESRLALLDDLQARGLVTFVVEPTKGADARRYFATKPPTTRPASLISLSRTNGAGT